MTNKIKTLRKLLESEMNQAESVIAARGFSQELQDMIQSLGRLLNEDLPAVVEQMRDALGADIATAFENQTSGVLQSVLDTLRSGKQNIDNSVSEIAGGGTPTGAGPSLGDDDLDFELGGKDELDLDLEDPTTDDESEAQGPELELDDPLGRPARESVETLKNKIAEARRMVRRARRLREGGWDSIDPSDPRALRDFDIAHDTRGEREMPRRPRLSGTFVLVKPGGGHVQVGGQTKTFTSRKAAQAYADQVNQRRSGPASHVKVSVMEAKRTEKDLDPNKPIKASGVKGTKSRPFSKKFRNFAAYEKWCDSEAADDFDVRQVENA